MTPERFRQIEELYHAAREGSADARAALMARADPELRREVESLLLDPAGGEFLDRPAIQNAPHLLEDSTLTELASGTRLGPYRIESKLGQGGMGKVFRAIDTRLGRAVAIKTTREQFNLRFEREARAISSLNHPNICILHDVGPNYLVMELVEGETIAARLKNGPLPLEEAIRYAGQIAAALEAAHEKGLIHRDLKPGNIMLTRSGVKVLDFGLATLEGDQTLTGERMVMGTPAYMAPEQREGRPADARTDIYAFGWVLYEMLTGARVTVQRRRIRARKLETIVSRCLEEDPGRRWQSAAELQRELAAIPRGKPGLYATAHSSTHRAPKLTQKTRIVLGEFENKTGDPVFDGMLRQGLSVQLEQSPFPHSRLGSTDPAGTALYGQAVRDAAHSRGRAGDLRAHRRHGCPGRLDCKPRKSVCLVVTGQKLQHRRHPGAGTGAGGQKRRSSECAHSDCNSNQGEAGRVAGNHPRALDGPRAGNHTLAGSLEGV